MQRVEARMSSNAPDPRAATAVEPAQRPGVDKALLDVAESKLADAMSGRLHDACGAAIMAMYDALMATLPIEERLSVIDHPNTAAARLAVARLAIASGEAELRILANVTGHFGHRDRRR
jgi:hypothetical protein